MTVLTGDPFKSFEGMLWIQTDGPNTTPFPLGCHMLGDLSKPEGDNEPIYCKDLSQPNSYRTVGKIKGQPGLVDVSIETDVTELVDYLEELRFPATIIATQTKAGKLDLITNWDVAYIVPGFEVTNRTWSGLVGKDTNERSNLATSGQALDVVVVRKLKGFRQSTSEVNAINSITFCDSDVQQSQFSTAHKTCDTLYAVADAAGAGTANVLYKVKDGPWTPMATDPFNADENIVAIDCVPLDRDTTRVIVWRGNITASPASGFAHVAFTDNNGVSWTEVDMGAVAGEYIADPDAVFALDFNNIWVGTSDGRIYYSNDGAASWSVQEDGVISTDPYGWIKFVSINAGMAGAGAGAVAITVDGGDSWSQVTVPSADNITCGELFNARQGWIGTDGGEIFYTNDAGLTWAEREFSLSGTGVVDSMAWFDQHVGVIVHTLAGESRVLFTKDGGFNWENVPVDSNSGFNKIVMCTERLAYAAGEVEGSTGMIVRIAPQQ